MASISEQPATISRKDPVFKFYRSSDFMPCIELDRDPELVTCPNCQNMIETKKVYKLGPHTKLNIFLLTPVLLCLIPLCMRSCQTIYHYCPVCGIALGVSTY